MSNDNNAAIDTCQDIKIAELMKENEAIAAKLTKLEEQYDVESVTFDIIQMLATKFHFIYSNLFHFRFNC